jgi:hypothetical protein
VLVDEEGEEMSPKIDNSKLFWQFAANYSSKAKHSFLLYVAKGKSSLLETARKGKQMKEDLLKNSQILGSPNAPNTTPGIQQSVEDSDDSGSDEYDMRINSEHLKLVSAKELTPPPTRALAEENDDEEASDDDLHLSLPPLDTFSRPRSLTDSLHRPSLVDKHRQEVEKILAETERSQNNRHSQQTSSRRVSLMDQKRYFLSFQSAGTISTSNIKKQNRRASTGMDGQKEKLSSAISKEDAALLALAKKSLRRQVTDDDINLLKVALPPEHLAKIHEWSIGASTSIPEENEALENGESPSEAPKEELTSTPALHDHDNEILHSDVVDETPHVDSEAEPLRNSIVNPQDDSSTESPSQPPPSTLAPAPALGVSRRKSNKFSLSKEDEELLQLARSSFQTNNALKDTMDVSKPDVTDGETLRLLMTIESTRSTSSTDQTTTPAKQSIAEKIRKLSPADEALLMLARHSIHPVASDSDMLSEYLTKTSELYSLDESKRDSENVEDDEDPDFYPRQDRGSMISLKEIHRNALLDAFQSICLFPQVDTAETRSTTDALNDGYLTREKFLSWEQIQSVLSEHVLNEEIVLEEFQKMAKEGGEIIKFDQFCDLMERLEILAEELTTLKADEGNGSQIDNADEGSPEEEHLGIPGDIRTAYKDLLSSQIDESMEGVTLESLLSWNQLQNAIKEQLLSREDVIQIFENVFQNLPPTELDPTPPQRSLDLPQFYQVSLELQKKIDISIGDLNALDKLAVPVMDEQMRLDALPPSRPHRRGSYRETLGDDAEIYQSNSNRQQLKHRNMSIHSSQSFESSVQDTFDQPSFLEIESELSNILITGHLFKQGGKVKNWKKRKFILKGCRLSYYDTRKLKGEFNTRDCEVSILPPAECNGSAYGFLINGPGRKLLLYANNEEDRVMWMDGIRQRIEEQERISQWEEQMSQMNQYQSEYHRTHSTGEAGDEANGEVNGDAHAVTLDGSDEEEESGMWSKKHSINSLRVVDSVDDDPEGEKREKLLSEGATIWHQFLDPGETLLRSGEIIKRNKYGMSQKRQLLLARRLSADPTVLIPPRLFYVDAATMRVKGEMEWDSEKTPQAEYVSLHFPLLSLSSLLCD